MDEISAAFNAVVGMNETLAHEMIRIERVVGREGRMAERVSLGEVRGGWEESVRAINALIGDLVQPTTEVARVISAVAEGDFTQKMALDFYGQPVKGEFLRIGTTVNSMVDQLSSFAAEVTRVAKEVGTEGKLGGQAAVPGVSGVWKDLTDNVNLLANNLTAQVRNIADVTTSVARGDLSKKITVDAKGEVLELKSTVNQMVDNLNSFAAEVTRVAKEVGTDGKLGGQADVKGVSGVWKDLTDNVNFLANNLTAQVRNIADVTTAVAKGDLSKKITVDAKGEVLALKSTVNTMVDQLNSFAAEVTRVAKEVGTDGKLGGQADVKGVSGVWKDLTDNVNFMATNLTTQVRGIVKVVTAVANGDLSQKLAVPSKGEIAALGSTLNNMTDTLNIFAQQVTSVARTVGVEGKLGAQAEVPGVAGTWKDLTDNVNLLANNLTAQVRNIAEVTTAVAKGDLSKKITVDAKGEVNELKNTINTMVDQLRSFAGEVTRVAKEVGTEGKLGGQAEVPGVSGTWKDLTDNVNGLARNLTDQVRNIAKVTTAVANGDLSQKITVDVKGEVLELKNTINTMVDQLRSFASEVTRVAKEVGTEGKLGGQAEVRGVSGTWKDLSDNVNVLAGNLTDQVRNIAKVTTAVANGDLSQKITVEARGEILELKNTINTMVEQLRSFASEVTRVAKEVGTDGKLGGQAEVKGVSGTWKDLTDNVNFMASNLTSQVRNIALVTTAVARGDLSKKITVDVKGEILELKNTINTMVDQLNSFASEVTRVAREVGTEGKLGGQAEVQGVAGVWKNLTDNVNFMARNLTTQVRGIVKVVTAVANGDLKQKLSVDAKGVVAALAETINNMTDTLSTFAEQVSTVAREVGVEGKLGGQARVPGVSGTWKDLTDNVNFMASNLTTQVRGIVKVVTAVANGDLTQKLVGVEAKGEIAALAETINNMTDTLGTFADQVSSVAREVGIEGKLGGQAKVPGALGTWRLLTDNVNQLAGTLTSQLRAISDVATAVTKGDLTRSIDVEAQGEVASLKDNINQMIINLRETTQKNQEQDWLKTNLAKFSSMMQGQKNLGTVSRLIMSELTPLVSAHHGAFFMMDSDSNLKLTSSYAYRERKSVSNKFRLGEGLVGQCALEKKSILLTKVPQDYIQISSGLGESTPLNIIVLPVLFEGEVKAVIELASFHPFSAIHQLFLDQLTESIGVVLNMISANMRTEELLQQSQSLTQELQSQSKELTQQQEELKRSNSALERQALELEEKARLLEDQNTKVEIKNREVEQARAAIEEKAAQLSLISKYKSEFLANMSHELRTPLNSLLILAKLLSDNKDTNLSEKQVEYARTIYASGGDLLALINEILDLSKVEAGKMQVEPRDIALREVSDFVERGFRPVAEQKGLEFTTEIRSGVPERIRTDPQRLQQVLKNLLANAFKFTDGGYVRLKVGLADKKTRFSNETLNRAERVISFSVVDTGIGIPSDKQKIIFEAFQQADGTTSRKYGGTGLGLSISREISKLLGGEIQVSSEQGKGSSFTLFLPEEYEGLASNDADVMADQERVARSEALLEEQLRLPQPMVDLSHLEDDREHLREGDRVVLIIEDDVKFARIMMSMARESGFKVVVATRGDAGLALANELQPSAITLDIQLPVVDGWSVLDRLKRNPRTAHIPVHVISVVERNRRAASLGAFAYLEKPVSKERLEGAFQHIGQFLDRKVKRLLLVEDNATESRTVSELVGGGEDVNITPVGSAEEALKQLEVQEYDCMVVDLVLPGLDGIKLVEQVKTQPKFHELPVVVYTGKELSSAEEKKLRTYAESIIIKNSAQSPERLLNDTALFLHRVQRTMPDHSRKILEEAQSTERSLTDKTVLVVDDDVRNIFAMTSVLEGQQMRVMYAETGREAIEMLRQSPEIDLVLMDVMMPEMDGYETMRAIRSDPTFKALPIIAVTAKALKDDREKCIDAGASDYLPKPVDPEKLLELMRLWTSK
ncbi:MAG: HAMP domain-containing protein [Myxococcaceae bacterium]